MQQATCAHSGAETIESPGNHDDISRRAIFAGIAGAAALLAFAPTAANTGIAQDYWLRAKAHYEQLKRQKDDLWARYKSMPSSARERMIGEEVERASEAEQAAWTALMTAPAPQIAALRWKLEQLLEIEDDGMSASWCERLVRPALDDIARLMRPAA